MRVTIRKAATWSGPKSRPVLEPSETIKTTTWQLECEPKECELSRKRQKGIQMPFARPPDEGKGIKALAFSPLAKRNKLASLGEMFNLMMMENPFMLFFCATHFALRLSRSRRVIIHIVFNVIINFINLWCRPFFSSLFFFLLKLKGAVRNVCHTFYDLLI